jgi:hypothetical protein
MASYIIRDIDKDVWHRVKTQALKEKRTVKKVIESLLAAWLKEKKA